MILFDFAIIFLVLHAIFYGLSFLEKQFLKNQNSYAYEVFDDQSLLWFKRIRMVNSIIGSIEIVTRGIPGDSTASPLDSADYNRTIFECWFSVPSDDHAYLHEHLQAVC